MADKRFKVVAVQESVEDHAAADWYTPEARKQAKEGDKKFEAEKIKARTRAVIKRGWRWRCTIVRRDTGEVVYEGRTYWQSEVAAEQQGERKLTNFLLRGDWEQSTALAVTAKSKLQT